MIVLGGVLFLSGLLITIIGLVSLAIPLSFFRIRTRRRGGQVAGAGIVLVTLGGFLIPTDRGGQSESVSQPVATGEVASPAGSATPISAGVSRESLPAYEVTGRSMLNDARIIEVKTEAPLGQLGAIAQAVIADELPNRPFMVRVFFFFPEETPGQGLPRYRVEWTASSTRSDDFTEQRKIAGLRY